MANDDDIVTRLRRSRFWPEHYSTALQEEAADEIERLRADLHKLRGGLRRAIYAADFYANWGGAKEQADELDDLRRLWEADDGE